MLGMGFGGVWWDVNIHLHVPSDVMLRWGWVSAWVGCSRSPAFADRGDARFGSACRSCGLRCRLVGVVGWLGQLVALAPACVTVQS